MLVNNSTIHRTHCTPISHSLVFIYDGGATWARVYYGDLVKQSGQFCTEFHVWKHFHLWPHSSAGSVWEAHSSQFLNPFKIQVLWLMMVESWTLQKGSAVSQTRVNCLILGGNFERIYGKSKLISCISMWLTDISVLVGTKKFVLFEDDWVAMPLLFFSSANMIFDKLGNEIYDPLNQCDWFGAWARQASILKCFIALSHITMCSWKNNQIIPSPGPLTTAHS